MTVKLNGLQIPPFMGSRNHFLLNVNHERQLSSKHSMGHTEVWHALVYEPVPRPFYLHWFWITFFK